jgi:hypothetical protein
MDQCWDSGGSFAAIRSRVEDMIPSQERKLHGLLPPSGPAQGRRVSKGQEAEIDLK